jgi:hypothetical protein
MSVDLAVRVETAGAMGLVAFDPQSGALANPDPHAPPSPSPAPEPRSGRESRSRFGRLPGFRRRS